ENISSLFDLYKAPRKVEKLDQHFRPFIKGHWILVLWLVTLVDAIVPLLLVPSAVVRVGAWDDTEEFGHDACECGIVGPDATFDKFTGIVEVVRTREDFRGYGDHATDEARQVLTEGIELDLFIDIEHCGTG